MNKEQLLRYANELNDTEQIVMISYSKFDIDYDLEDNGQPKLTEEQWEKFRYWMAKYVDVEQDYNDALHFALKDK